MVDVDLDRIAVGRIDRRSGGRLENRIVLGDLAIDPVARSAILADKPVDLTAREFALLIALARRPGATVSREQLEEALYGWDALSFLAALLTAFFLFRDGDRLLEQLRSILRGLFGDRVQAYFTAVGETTRAVVCGLLLAALAQGLTAGLGYWAAGVRAPAFWGAATVVVALIPFGAPLVWASIGVWLLLQGDLGAGIGLLLWGALAVSAIDNLVRIVVISSVTEIPIMLVLFGGLGGIAYFGLIGLLVGPLILAILYALWREWAADNAHRAPTALAPPTSIRSR
jgi:hypothetical protein